MRVHLHQHVLSGYAPSPDKPGLAGEPSFNTALCMPDIEEMVLQEKMSQPLKQDRLGLCLGAVKDYVLVRLVSSVSSSLYAVAVWNDAMNSGAAAFLLAVLMPDHVLLLLMGRMNSKHMSCIHEHDAQLLCPQ
jgi:hypothetical protein